MKLVSSLVEALFVGRVDDKDDGLGSVEVVAPQRSDLQGDNGQRLI